MKLSIIVPVYNVENYISKCIDSILHQGFSEKEYEIILVNDGSKDSSQIICEEYSKKYPNIFLYNKENGGVSSARNLGLEKAKGDYVVFVDSDDYIVENAYSYLFRTFVSENIDVLRFWITIVTENTPINNSYKGELKFKGSGFKFIENYGLETFCYTSLYKRSFLKEKEIKFKNYRIGEDFLFASTVLLNNPQIKSTSCNVYRYVIHPNTASTGRNTAHVRKCVEDHLAVNDDLLNQIKSLKLKKESLLYKQCFNSIKGKMSLIFSRALSANYSNKEFSFISKRCKEQGLLPLEFKGTTKEKISSLLINILTYNPSLYTCFSGIYRKFFVPYILKRLDRNN